MGYPPKAMKIEAFEKHQYFKALRSFYGVDIAEEPDLDTVSQKQLEIQRHKFNARFNKQCDNLDFSPKRLLFCVTQKCTSHCSHCWIFSSSSADCSLTLNELSTIHQNTISKNPPTWTLSGGEFFTLNYYQDIIEQFPVQCIYTNAFWGYPLKQCLNTVKNIKRALVKNKTIKKNFFTLIISYDKYHCEGIGKQYPLSQGVVNIIHEFYKNIPQTSIRISQIATPGNSREYNHITEKLRNMGYTVKKTDRNEANSNISTISFTYKKNNGLRKELFFDLFPISPICRGLLLANPKQTTLKETPAYKLIVSPISGQPHSRHQYTIGPDGGVGLYEILYAPPVPYYLGNLTRESWAKITKKIQKDPIATVLKSEGIYPFIRFMNIYYKELLNSLSYNIETIQQLLYLILLNPIRRLLLNTFLLKMFSIDKQNSCFQKLENILENQNKSEREKEILDLYGISN
jgi:hypothetical protein